MHKKCLLGNVKERNHSEDLEVHEKIIFEWILREIGWESVEWIHLGQDRDQWRAVLNTVMKRWVTYNAGNFLTSRVSVSFSRRSVS
jgi:hypothetical protein